MLNSLHYGFYDFWEYDPERGFYGNQSVTFDGPNKLIKVNQGITFLDVDVDIYSNWKE